MTQTEDDFFLIVGSIKSESATTEIRSSGRVWIQKMLNSKPYNWRSIIELIKSPHNRGTIVQLSARDYGRIASEDYSEVATSLFENLTGKSHIIFVHEAVFLTDEQRSDPDDPGAPAASSDSSQAQELTEEEIFSNMMEEDMFPRVPEEARTAVNELLRMRKLDVRPYVSNFERSTMARKFIEESQSNLLFRVYVPSGRLYADETEGLLGLFRDWLGTTGRGSVRQDGYKTNAGQVIEFHMEQPPEKGLSAEWSEFERFLATCERDPGRAEEVLVEQGLPKEAAKRLVSKWHLEFGRLTIAMKSQHRVAVAEAFGELEAINFEFKQLTEEEIQEAVGILLPMPTITTVIENPAPLESSSMVVNHVNIQHITAQAGAIVQSAQGTANFGVEARQLQELILAHAGDRGLELQSALLELEDEGTRGEERTVAKSRLKSFLASLSEKTIDVGFGVLSRYIESKTGF